MSLLVGGPVAWRVHTVAWGEAKLGSSNPVRKCVLSNDSISAVHGRSRRIADGAAAGEKVRALKPVISGFDPADAAQSDTGRLLSAMGRPTSNEDIAAISPWRYIAPLSPDMAAVAVPSRASLGSSAGLARPGSFGIVRHRG